jgi:hypothetical protein
MASKEDPAYVRSRGMEHVMQGDGSIVAYGGSHITVIRVLGRCQTRTMKTRITITLNVELKAEAAN